MDFWGPPFPSCLPVVVMPSLLLQLPLRLCRLWPHSLSIRLLTAATGQRSVPTNYYELLGVHPGASAEEIKRAFFTKSKEVLVPPRKLEQVHRSFMDEKDRIITAIYNDTRARARANRARIQQERQQRQQPRAEPSLPPESSRIMPQDTSP